MTDYPLINFALAIAGLIVITILSGIILFAIHANKQGELTHGESFAAGASSVALALILFWSLVATGAGA